MIFFTTHFYLLIFFKIYIIKINNKLVYDTSSKIVNIGPETEKNTTLFEMIDNDSVCTTEKKILKKK